MAGPWQIPEQAGRGVPVALTAMVLNSEKPDKVRILAARALALLVGQNSAAEREAARVEERRGRGGQPRVEQHTHQHLHLAGMSLDVARAELLRRARALGHDTGGDRSPTAGTGGGGE